MLKTSENRHYYSFSALRNQQVAGSSPATSSSSSRTAQVRDDFFMLCIKKSSLTCSVAPRFKIVTASLGCDFVFYVRRFLFCLFVFRASKPPAPHGDLLITNQLLCWQQNAASGGENICFVLSAAPSLKEHTHPLKCSGRIYPMNPEN